MDYIIWRFIEAAIIYMLGHFLITGFLNGRSRSGTSPETSDNLARIGWILICSFAAMLMAALIILVYPANLLFRISVLFSLPALGAYLGNRHFTKTNFFH